MVFILLTSQSVVAKHVVLKSTCDFSLLVTHLFPVSSIGVEMREYCFVPVACCFAWKSVSTVSVDN